VRFVRTNSGWQPDPGTAQRKQPGRGAYLCSARCAQQARKNKRYPGLGAAAAEYGLIKPVQEANSMTACDDRSLR
jgi:predicted RNA-binding protein YlxR (DUF448 family)